MIQLLVQFAEGDQNRVRVRVFSGWIWGFLGHDAFVVGTALFTRLSRIPPPLLRHELTHVAQYRRFGVAGFLWRYLTSRTWRRLFESEAAGAMQGQYPTAIRVT